MVTRMGEFLSDDCVAVDFWNRSLYEIHSVYFKSCMVDLFIQICLFPQCSDSKRKFIEQVSVELCMSRHDWHG